MSFFESIVRSTGPDLWYRLNEANSAFTSTDHSGNGHDGTNITCVNSFGLVPSDTDAGRLFNGTNSRVIIPTSFTVPAGSPITVLFFFEVGISQVKKCSFFNIGGLDNPNRCQAHIWDDGHIYWDYGDLTTQGRITSPYTADVRHFVALTSTGAGNTAKTIWVDGSPSNTSATSTGPVTALSGGDVGAWLPPLGPGFYKGHGDEFIVWKRQLTAAEIHKIYQAAIRSLALSDSNVGFDVVHLLEDDNILSFADGNIGHDNFNFGGEIELFGDKNTGLETLCIRIAKKLGFSDSNIGHDAFGRVTRWDDPGDGSTLGGGTGYIVQPSTYPLTIAQSGKGQESVRVVKNGILVVEGGCH